MRAAPIIALALVCATLSHGPVAFAQQGDPGGPPPGGFPPGGFPPGGPPPGGFPPGGPPGGPGGPGGGMPPLPVLVRQAAPRNAWNKPNFNGVWSHNFFSPGDKIFYALPAFGGLPDLSMLQPWAQQAYRQHYDDMQAGKQVLITAMRCLPAGVPNIMMEAHALQMVLTKDELIVLVESDHQIRIVPIGDNLKHSAHITPSWNGDAIAHWDGDTLVIDTVGLTDRSELDPMGTPHSEQLHVEERIHYDEFGQVIIDTTLTDPLTLVRPWTYHYHYSKGGREATSENVGEYACAENNRDGTITPDN